MTRLRTSRRSLLLWTLRRARLLSNQSRPAIQVPMIMARTELDMGFTILSPDGQEKFNLSIAIEPEGSLADMAR